MDQNEKDLIEKNLDKDPELKSVWEDHTLFSRQVDQLVAKPYRTPAEEQQLKQLKKQKLEAKTGLMNILDRLKAAEKQG